MSLHVPNGDGALLGEWRRSRVAAASQVGGDACRHPRRAVGAAADHDRVGARGIERSFGALRTDDVAVDDDGDAHDRLDAAHEAPIGRTLEELAAGAGMDSDQLHAGGLARRASSGALRSPRPNPCASSG
jgi:hypothetical protein